MLLSARTFEFLQVLEIMRTLTTTESACPSKSVSEDRPAEGSSRIVRLTFARAARMPRGCAGREAIARMRGRACRRTHTSLGVHNRFEQGTDMQTRGSQGFATDVAQQDRASDNTACDPQRVQCSKRTDTQGVRRRVHSGALPSPPAYTLGRRSQSCPGHALPQTGVASAVTALLDTLRGTTAAPSTTRDATMLITPATEACGAVMAARLEAVVARDVHEMLLHRTDIAHRSVVARATTAASKAASFAVAEISRSASLRSDPTTVAMTSPKIMRADNSGGTARSLRSDHNRTQVSDILSNLDYSTPLCGVGGVAAMTGNAKASGLIGYSGAFALVDAVHWAQVLIIFVVAFVIMNRAISLL